MEYRSTNGFIVNVVCGLIAYCVKPKKPSLNLQNSKALALSLNRTDVKYYIFVNIPTSWLISKKSHMDIIDWFKNYRKKNTKLVGVVELFNDYTLYNWGKDVHWPPASPYYVAVFERQPEIK